MRMPPVLLAFTISRFGLDKVGPAEDVLFFGGADEVTAGCLVEVLSGDEVTVGCLLEILSGDEVPVGVISGGADTGGAVIGGAVTGGAVSVGTGGAVAGGAVLVGTGREGIGAGVEGAGAGVEGAGANMLENFRGTGAGDRINEGCSVSSDQVCGDFWK